MAVQSSAIEAREDRWCYIEFFHVINDGVRFFCFKVKVYL